MTTPPDVVYVLKRKSQYEELRYSLRSLKNIAHGKVFISGACPDWAVNVIHTPVEKIAGESRYQNAERNWLAALQHPDLADNFIAMNDDFFIMKPIDDLQNWHDGDLLEHHDYRVKVGAHPNYTTAMRIAYDRLRESGVEQPKGYTLHVPMLMNKYKRVNLHHMMREEILRGEIVLIRTYYGNLYELGGERMPDVKFADDQFTGQETFLSTTDPSFKYERVGQLIRETFTEKSPYER